MIQSNCQTDLKVILVGDERSGKTCLLKKFTEDRFSEDYNPTLYDEFETRLEVAFGQREYKISLVELGGSDECSSHTPVTCSRVTTYPLYSTTTLSTCW